MSKPASLPVRVESDPANSAQFRLYDDEGRGVTVLPDGALMVVEGEYTSYPSRDHAAAIRDGANERGH